MHRSRLFIITVIALLCAGCSMGRWTEEQCQYTDMHERGLTDGRSGSSSDAFIKYQTDCNRYELTLNRNDYMAGWRQGNAQYCVPDNMYQVGKQNKAFPVVCDMNNHARYSAYARGKKIGEQIAAIKAQIHDIDEQLNKTNKLVERHNALTKKMADARSRMDYYKEGPEYDAAKNDLHALRQQEKVLLAEMAISAAQDIANKGHLDQLRAKKGQLQQELGRLSSL